MFPLPPVTDISSREGQMHTHTHTHTHSPALAALTAAEMKLTHRGLWTWTLVTILLADSCRAHKLNVHWGPQSMMYLKGKHGRRFVSEDDSRVVKQGLQSWYALLRGIQKLQSMELKEPDHVVSSENVLIGYLQKR